MSEIFWTAIREPGYWALAFLLACAVATLIASLALRGTRRRFADLVNELIDEGRLTKADKAWLRAEIERSKGAHLLIASPFAPFAILGALAVAAYEGWLGERHDVRLEQIEADIDRLHAETVELSQGVDPRTGNYWKDERHREIRHLSMVLETWNNPLSMIWITAWLAIASPFMVLAYFVTGSLKPFIMNVWEPLRDPILAVLESVRVKKRLGQA